MISRFFPMFGGGYTHISLLSLNIVCWKLIFLLANIYIIPLSEHVSASHIHDVFIVHSILYVHYIYMLHYCIYIYIYTYTYKYVYMYVLCNIHHFARWLQFSGERLASSSSLSSFRALWASKSPWAAAKRLLQKLRGFLSSGSENEVYIPLAMSIRDMMINPENLGVPSFSQKGLL